ncbi:MAG: AMP-binding protein [Anaerovoracaceae bacterium]
MTDQPQGSYPVRQIYTIKELINTGAIEYKEKPAFLVKEEKGGPYREITHKKLKNDVDALGTKLIDMGLQGEKIAIIGENSYEWAVSYFAVVNGAGVVVPLDRELSKEEVYHLMKTADCKALIYSSLYEDYAKDAPADVKIKFEHYRNDYVPFDTLDMAQIINDGRRLISQGDRRFLDAQIDPEEVRILLFTSGTTGTPKAVMLCHRNIISNVLDITRIVKLKEDERSLSILPMHHTFESTINLMTMLYQGGSIAMFEGLKYVSKNLKEAQATVLVGVPLIFESIYNKLWKQAEKTNKARALRAAMNINGTLIKLGIDQRHRLFRIIYDSFGGKLRTLVTGAAAIDPKVIRGFHDLGLEVHQGYGLTETAPLLSGCPDGEMKYRKTGSSGPVVPSGELKIDDANDEGIGEILYKGPNVMLGYYKMPEETAAVMKDGWFCTGDLGFMDESGWLYITGRKKNVIVTKTGKNIYPEELELLINDFDYVEECMVYGLEGMDAGGGTQVAVQIRVSEEFVSKQLGKEHTKKQTYDLLKDCLSQINEKLPNYKRIRHLVVRDTDFIKTTTHKIKRMENI